MESLFSMTMYIEQTTAVETPDADVIDSKTELNENMANLIGNEHTRTTGEENPSAESIPARLRKGRKRKYLDQSRVERKRRCNLNQPYVNAKGVGIKPKEFDRNFDCRCQRKCTEKMDADARLCIFSRFWSAGTYEARCSLLNESVKEIEKKRQYTKEQSKRKKTRLHFLNGMQVCKKAFLATFSINQSRLDVALMKKRTDNLGDNRGIRRKRTSVEEIWPRRAENRPEPPENGGQPIFLDQPRTDRKPRCNRDRASRLFNRHFDCGCKRGCTEKVDAETRLRIFSKFWTAGTYEARCTLLNECVKEIDKKRQYAKEQSRRRKTRLHFLNGTQVCKQTFLATFAINPSGLNMALNKKRMEDLGDNHGKNSSSWDPLTEDKAKHVEEHIRQFPGCVSKCKTDASLPIPGLSLTKMYDLYLKENMAPVSFSAFRRIFCSKYKLPCQSSIKDAVT